MNAWNEFKNTALNEDCDQILIREISLDSNF
jgi:hypothetical protein